MPDALLDANIAAERWRLRGLVQGVGLRPVVARLAMDLGVAGAVRNVAGGVEIDVESSVDALEAMHERLLGALPPASHMIGLDRSPQPAVNRTGFEIESSFQAGREESPAAAVPPDRAICGLCLEETCDDADRRHDYPFASCADCGPRFSIVQKMPFDRERTTMDSFDLCPECRREYETSADRRFHAQTIACPTCGPHVWLSAGPGKRLAERGTAVARAVAALHDGRIVAMKGIGGYQLLVDATSNVAVERLRLRKRRPAKPLAVLVDSLQLAERLAFLDDVERAALTSPVNPIVIVRRGHDSPLARAVTSDFDTVGLLLPTTPLHAQLVRRTGRPLVCTSGNVEGQPLAFEIDAAERELAGVADLWLHHDRPIRRPIDDSVVRVMAGRVTPLRLARGLAPLPLPFSLSTPMVALGGHQHAAFAVANGAQAALGPHVGDLDDAATRSRYLAQLQNFQALYGIDDALATCDAHPDYFTTTSVAPRYARSTAIRHHQAHAAAGLADAGWLPDVSRGAAALAVTFDGTGFGADGTIWGGEWLRMCGRECTRVGSLLSYRLPGGEAAVREPWRVAAGMLETALDRDAAIAAASRWGATPRDVANVLTIARRPTWSPLCTSGGRLFDAAAAIALNRATSAFDGEPAMRLEAACDRSATGAYPFTVIGGPLVVLDWRPALRALVADRAAEAPPGVMAMRFHRGLADGIARVCEQFAPLPVVLGGGVFQNRILIEELLVTWRNAKQPLALPGAIPPGDGGLAAGQLAVAWLTTEGRGLSAQG